jgi:ATP-dependent Lhr-like helicase
MASPSLEEILDQLHPGLQRWIRYESRWRDFSPIQRAAIPAILAGGDCVVEAPTAGGKTEAVLFPTLTRAAEAHSPPVRVLYWAPLRALLNNLQRRGEDYAALCGMRAFKWHGDVGQAEKLEALQDPPHLLMTTPESLEAILLRKPGWKELFGNVRAVILDEAHNFAAGERGGHLLCLLERLEQASAQPPQRIALSATLGNPEAMLGWLAGTKRLRGERVVVATPPREDRDFQIRFFNDAGETDETPAEERSSYRRFMVLRGVLRPDFKGATTRSLVFVRSRKAAEALAEAFARANARLPSSRHLRARTHHSAVSKYFREEAERLIQDTSEDGLQAVVSTSTLELGIDIGELDRVVQMDALTSSSSFLQRVGRTGRRPGKPQFFRGLVCDLDDLVLTAAVVSLGLAGRSEALLLPRRAFDLLAHQLLCLALQSFGIGPDHAWEILRGAHCFSGISRQEVGLLVAHMVAEDYLRQADGLLVVGEKAEREYLHSNWRRLFAVFDSAPLYEVLHGRQQIGTLDASFVEALEPPFFFVLGGKLWRADETDPEARIVHASPSREGTAPAWQSFGGPGVPYETAQEAGRLLHTARAPVFLDEEGGRAFETLQAMSASDGWSPRSIAVRVSAGGSASVVTFAGDQINRTLARFLVLQGVGRATAGYSQVEVQGAKRGREALTTTLGAALASLRTGPWSDPGRLAHALEENQPLWPFSPFARCLPPRLWASALVEQTLDPEGLLRLVHEWTG